MRILFLGDIVGRTGREAVQAHLPGLRETLRLDFVIINAEHSAAGGRRRRLIIRNGRRWNVIWGCRGFDIVPVRAKAVGIGVLTGSLSSNR